MKLNNKRLKAIEQHFFYIYQTTEDPVASMALTSFLSIYAVRTNTQPNEKDLELLSGVAHCAEVLQEGAPEDHQEALRIINKVIRSHIRKTTGKQEEAEIYTKIKTAIANIPVPRF